MPLTVLRAIGTLVAQLLDAVVDDGRAGPTFDAPRLMPPMFDADGRPTLDRNVAVNPTAF